MRDRIRFLQLLFSSSVYDIGIGLLLGFFTVYLVEYMTSEEEGGLGLEKSMYSFTLSFCVIAYMITTVIAGAFSDDLRSKYGNRIPFVVSGGTAIAVLFVVGYLLLKGNEELWIMAILLFVFVSIARGITASPFQALMSELFEKDARGWSALARTLFSSVGTGIAVWLFPPLAKKGQYPEMFIIIAFVFFISTVITALMVPKINPDFPPDKTIQDLIATPRLLWAYGRGEFGKMLICQVFWGLGTGTINYFWVLFTKENLDATIDETVLLLLWLSIMAALFAIPIGISVTKIGKVRTGALASILYICFIFFLMTASSLEYSVLNTSVGGIEISYPVGRTALITLFGGASIIGLSTIVMSLPADLVPEGKEAQFFGINTIFTMFPDPITLTIAGFILGGVIVESTNAQFNLLFSIAIIEISIATLALLWIEYEGWVKDEYTYFYTRFLRAKNRLPDRTWAGSTFKEYYYKKIMREEDFELEEENDEINIEDVDNGRIKDKIREW